MSTEATLHQSELQASQTLLLEVQHRLAEAQRELIGLQREHPQLQQQFDATTSQLRIQIDEAHTQYVGVCNELKESEAKNDITQQEVIRLRAQYQEAVTDLQMCREELLSATTDRAHVSSQLHTKSSQLDQLHELLSVTQRQVSASSETNATLQRRCQDLDSEHGSLVIEYTSLCKRIAALEAALADTTAEIKARDSTIQRLQQDAIDKEGRLIEANQSLTLYSSTMEQLTQQLRYMFVLALLGMIVLPLKKRCFGFACLSGTWSCRIKARSTSICCFMDNMKKN